MSVKEISVEELKWIVAEMDSEQLMVEYKFGVENHQHAHGMGEPPELAIYEAEILKRMKAGNGGR